MKLGRTLLAGLAALAAFQQAVKADPPAPYAAMGAPPSPKVQASWNHYYDTAAIARLLDDLAAAHPTRARIYPLGTSYGGRPLRVLAITNFNLGVETEKPGFWIDGSIHANEIQGVEVALYTAWMLLESYPHNAFIRRLLDERVIYVLPALSPDSRDSHFYEPNTTSSPRSGQRPVDDDRDGLFDEDGADDLDGDGNIVQMRVRDPHGKWKPHPDYPQAMVRVDPDEEGQYSMLGQEGIDNDGDGAVNEDGAGFYDPNRGWGWNWQPGYVQFGAHRYPFSILENRMAADFIAAHSNIGGAQSYHNAGGMILRGPGVKGESYDSTDNAVYLEIGKKGELILPGYRSMNVANDLYEAFGSELDWLHESQGVFAFTNELFTQFNLFRRAEGAPPLPNDADEQHVFNRYLLLGGGFVEWREVDHPQYGRVEVGGFKKSWGRQPPSFLLEEECHRNMAFSLYHADQLPRLAVERVESKPLVGGLTEVTAVITNDRLIPTRSVAGMNRKITPPDEVSIEGEGLSIAAGMIADEPYFLRPREQERDPAVLKVSRIPGMGAVYVRWLLTGQGPYTVKVRSIKGGRAEGRGG
jgi:hypothetical protein